MRSLYEKWGLFEFKVAHRESCTKHEACQERSQRSPPKIWRVISDLSGFTFQIANNKGAYQTSPAFHRFKSFAIIQMREREVVL